MTHLDPTAQQKGILTQRGRRFLTVAGAIVFGLWVIGTVAKTPDTQTAAVVSEAPAAPADCHSYVDAQFGRTIQTCPAQAQPAQVTAPPATVTVYAVATCLKGEHCTLLPHTYDYLETCTRVAARLPQDKIMKVFCVKQTTPAWEPAQ
jgi:hypothetical protein